MSVIELQNINKYYHTGTIEICALSNISFKIEEGEFVSISGPSGSGKSTILNLLGLIDYQNSGKLKINNQAVLTDDEIEHFVITGNIPRKTDSRICKIRKNNIGFIFQTFNLLPVMNVYENIEYPLHLNSQNTNNMSKSEKKDWIEYLIKKVGLEQWKDHKPNELSGGQRQRVAIARALVGKSKIVLADEPTANLDSKTGDQILQLMQDINQEFKTTFIFSTHDKKIVDMTKHVIRIMDGQVVEDVHS